MSSKFVEAPNLINAFEGSLAEYGIHVTVSEVGIAVVVGVTALKFAKTFLSAS